MRNIQLYENFKTPQYQVAAYTDTDEWLEFLKSELRPNNYKMVDGGFWKDKMDQGAIIYLVDSPPGFKKWFFWRNPNPGWNDPTPSHLRVSLIKDDINSMGMEAQSLSYMEKDLKCSYQELIDQAKTPEEIMDWQMMRYPSSYIKSHSETRPLVFNKVLSNTSIPEERRERYRLTAKNLSKWDKIKNYI